MRRALTELNIEQITKFIQSNRLLPDVENDAKARTLSINALRLMSNENVDFLSLYYKDLEEKEATEALKELGFESNISFREKIDLLKGVIRINLTDVIKTNIKLLLKKDVFGKSRKNDGFQKYQDLIEKTTRREVNKYLQVFKIKNKVIRRRKIREHFILDRNINRFLDLYDMNDFEYQLSEKNLPALKKKDIEKPSEKLKDAEPEDRPLSKGKKPRKIREISIYDKVDNVNVILRKKKILKLEPSGHIDYHVDRKFKLKSIRKKIDALPTVKFDLQTYEEFDLRAFIEDILYIRNGIEPPKNSNFKSVKDFKSKAKRERLFFNQILWRFIARLLMKQDKYLSFRDAKMLSKEIRCNLLMKDIEYFYNVFYNSGHYFTR